MFQGGRFDQAGVTSSRMRVDVSFGYSKRNSLGIWATGTNGQTGHHLGHLQDSMIISSSLVKTSLRAVPHVPIMLLPSLWRHHICLMQAPAQLDQSDSLS